MFRPGDEPVPGYRLEEILGRGGSGEVWRATAPGETSVALKLIGLSGSHGPKELRAVWRFKEIRHAHLVPITALWLLDRDGNVLAQEATIVQAPSGQTTCTVASGCHSPSLATCRLIGPTWINGAAAKQSASAASESATDFGSSISL